MKNIAYHFVGATLRDGRPIPKDGEWLEHTGPLEMCRSGLHWSLHPYDALRYAPGSTLCLVEYDGDVQIDHDKGVSTRRRIIKRIDASQLLQEFARWCALQVIELWQAPEIVKHYLTTGDPASRSAAWSAAGGAAWSAAGSAAGSAAWSAAWSAAGGAAWSAAGSAALNAAGSAAGSAAWSAAWSAALNAARSAQKERFLKMVETAFEQAQQ